LTFENLGEIQNGDACRDFEADAVGVCASFGNCRRLYPAGSGLAPRRGGVTIIVVLEPSTTLDIVPQISLADWKLRVPRAGSKRLYNTMNKHKKRALRSAIKGKPACQVGVLPYRLAQDGSIWVLLITSRETRRFILPKGWPMKNKTRAAAAACEAEEEAGVVGHVRKHSIGSFRYWKRLATGFVPINVRVFPMEVERELHSWKEKNHRGRKWLRPEEAAALLDEPELASLVRQTPRLLS